MSNNDQQQFSYQQFIPSGQETLQRKLKSVQWKTRKQSYSQILYILEQNQITSLKSTFSIGGKQYTVHKLIPIFEDIVDEDHPIVLLAALQCVQLMIVKGLCSGRQFVKLTDQGFDKFPLKTNRGKQIMEKFADIIEKIDLDEHFLANKLSTCVHEKCVIFTLEVVSMLGMTHLYKKVKQMSKKHPKSAVREVASQICRQLEQIFEQEGETCQNEQQKQPQSKQREIKLHQTRSNQVKVKRKKSPGKINQVKEEFSNTFSRQQQDILEKISQFQQLSSKDQQKYSQNFFNFFSKYFKMVEESKQVPPLPSNQLSNLSHIIRLMVESNNVILSTNGLKILKILIKNNSPYIPRSYPLLFILQKFKMHATHQVNQLLYDVCDSLLLYNGVSTARNIDLLQAVYEGGNNKKVNVKFGSLMVFLRCVSILYDNEKLFEQNFGNEDSTESKLNDIFQKINEGDLDKLKTKLYRNLTKCLQNFNAKMSDDKKYDQKLQDIRICMSIAYGNNNNTQSVDNLKNKTLKKNLSQVSSKIQTFNNIKPKTPNSIHMNTSPKQTNNFKSKSVHGVKNYKILNPQQKTNKILQLCKNPTLGSINIIKKTVIESLLEFQQCLDQQIFQLFYYSEVIQNFIMQYEPDQKTSDIISQYLLQILLKISKISFNKNLRDGKFFIQGIRNILKICFCDLVIGQQQLVIVLNNFLQRIGISKIIQSILQINKLKKQLKVKKKNRKIIVKWLDQNVSTDCLNNQYFQIVQKIQNGYILGKFNKINIFENDHDDQNYTQSNQFQSNNYKKIHKKENQNEEQFRRTFGKLQNDFEMQNQTNKNEDKQDEDKDEQENEEKHEKYYENLKMQKKITFNKDNNKNYFVNEKQKFLEPNNYQNFSHDSKQDNKHSTPKNLNKNQQNLMHIPQISPIRNPLDRSQISHIQYRQDPSISILTSGHPQTDREFPVFSQSNYPKVSSSDQENDQYLNYYNQYKKQKQKSFSEDINAKTDQNKKSQETSFSQKKKFAQNQSTFKKQDYEYSVSRQEESIAVDESHNLEQYKEYVQKIRQTYMPKEYLNNENKQIQQNNSIDDHHEKENDKINLQSLVEVSKQQQPKSIFFSQQSSKPETKQQQQQNNSNQHQQKEQSQKQQQFEYKLINANKLNYMLQNASNPYSHLRNQIIIPFKKSLNKEFFLKQFNLFVTSMNSIKHPQPYNSLLLAIILLFSEIHTNRNLITPLQELYQYMATLGSTNQFVRTIISLFHSVIQETPSELRMFLITILTKSIARLMPYCQDPSQLLRDLSQFYNVGQNVYFEMYVQEYTQICNVLEGDSLFQVVQRSLQKQGQNLKQIVESWFDTKMKLKIKEYINQIMIENMEQKYVQYQ